MNRIGEHALNARYVNVVNTLYVIALGIALQSLVKLSDSQHMVLLVGLHNLHLVVPIMFMLLFRWMLFNSYQETCHMESRKAYFIDLAQIITFLFCLFACLSGGTLGTLGFLLYLFIRGVVELMYARDFRAVSSTALEHASYDNDKILQHIYSENHDVLGSHIDQRKFIEIVLPAMQARKIPQEDITNLRKNGQEIVFLNRLSFVVSTFGIILAGYLMIAPKILHLIHPPDERFAEALYQVPIILVVYFVFMIQGVVHVYTANTHVRHSNLTKGLL